MKKVKELKRSFPKGHQVTDKQSEIKCLLRNADQTLGLSFVRIRHFLMFFSESFSKLPHSSDTNVIIVI